MAKAPPYTKEVPIEPDSDPPTYEAAEQLVNQFSFKVMRAFWTVVVPVVVSIEANGPIELKM
jgi:hypothetical protein